MESGHTSGAFHVVEIQLANAAWRLAGWMNSIATTCFRRPNFEVEGDAYPGGNGNMIDISDLRDKVLEEHEQQRVLVQD